MENLINSLDTVFIHHNSWESEVSRRLRSLFPFNKIEKVFQRPFPEHKGELSAEEFNRSKRLLYVTSYEGQFFKRCPGSKPGLTCCNYFVLNLGLQCNMNCSYCYLQSFINTPVMTLYSNIDKALLELENLAQNQSELAVRVGTGETVDSLSLDPLTLYSKPLIEFFSRYPRWKLEFKTKSSFVDQFIDLPHLNNIIVSWSLNPQFVIDTEEQGTASLVDRLTAAEKCKQKGFLLSFHLDPVVWHPQWKESYSSLVNEITKRFLPEDLFVMSLGALRFQPEQRFLMKERFGSSTLVNRGEMYPSSDGKLRYDKELRNEMFQFIIQEFKSKNSRWSIFLCMETPESWISSLGGLPKQHSDLTELFDHKISRSIEKGSHFNKS